MVGCCAKRGQREERECPLVGGSIGIGEGEGGGKVTLHFVRPIRSSELTKEAMGGDPRERLVRVTCRTQGLLRTATSARSFARCSIIPRPGVAVAGTAEH